MEIHYFQEKTTWYELLVYSDQSSIKKIILWSLTMQPQRQSSVQNMKAFHWNTDYCQVTWNADSLHCYCWELTAFNNSACMAFF